MPPRRADVGGERHQPGHRPGVVALAARRSGGAVASRGRAHPVGSTAQCRARRHAARAATSAGGPGGQSSRVPAQDPVDPPGHEVVEADPLGPDQVEHLGGHAAGRVGDDRAELGLLDQRVDVDPLDDLLDVDPVDDRLDVDPVDDLLDVDPAR